MLLLLGGGGVADVLRVREVRQKIALCPMGIITKSYPRHVRVTRLDKQKCHHKWLDFPSVVLCFRENQGMETVENAFAQALRTRRTTSTGRKSRWKRRRAAATWYVWRISTSLGLTSFQSSTRRCLNKIM